MPQSADALEVADGFVIASNLGLCACWIGKQQ